MVSYLRPWLEKAKGRRFIAGQIRDNKKEITPACFSAYLQRRARPRGSRVGRGQSVHLFGLGPLAMTQLHISRKRFWRGGRRRFGSFLAKIGLRKRSSSLYKPRSQPKPRGGADPLKPDRGRAKAKRPARATLRFVWAGDRRFFDFFESFDLPAAAFLVSAGIDCSRCRAAMPRFCTRSTSPTRPDKLPARSALRGALAGS